MSSKEALRARRNGLRASWESVIGKKDDASHVMCAAVEADIEYMAATIGLGTHDHVPWQLDVQPFHDLQR